MQVEPKKRGRPPKAKPEEAQAVTPEVVAQGLGIAFDYMITMQREGTPVVDFVEPVIVGASMSLNDYVQFYEQDNPVVVEVSHPDAQDGGFYTGRFSGIRLKKGECRVLFSDGTTK